MRLRETFSPAFPSGSEPGSNCTPHELLLVLQGNAVAAAWRIRSLPVVELGLGIDPMEHGICTIRYDGNCSPTSSPTWSCSFSTLNFKPERGRAPQDWHPPKPTRTQASSAQSIDSTECRRRIGPELDFLLRDLNSSATCIATPPRRARKAALIL